MGAPTVRAALIGAAGILTGAGVPEARREAQLLLCHALGVGREIVVGHPDRRLDAGEAKALDALVERRRAREPAAYILGEREFWSLPFRVSPRTLIPRPDSEALIETALGALDALGDDHGADRQAPLAVLDLGTGSGCLLLALLSELPRATGVGVDIDGGALDMARINARALGLAGRAHFVQGDWNEDLGLEKFDLIVANPPYVPDGEIDRLEPEVARFEPRRALSGGIDGLESYRSLAPALALLLGPGGTAVVEIGAGQATAVAAIMAGYDMGALGDRDNRGRRHDLSGVERCLLLGRNGKKSRSMERISLETGTTLAK